jgi:hypothetical protein
VGRVKKEMRTLVRNQTLDVLPRVAKELGVEPVVDLLFRMRGDEVEVPAHTHMRQRGRVGGQRRVSVTFKEKSGVTREKRVSSYFFSSSALTVTSGSWKGYCSVCKYTVCGTSVSVRTMTMK